MPLRWFAPAKLNLYLHVTGRRDDGFHLLDSLVAFVSIGDELTVEPSDKLSLEIAGPFAGVLDGAANDNLVWRAAEMLAARLGTSARVKITLTKNLPVASGIGGGSSDAAACLRALVELWRADDPAMLMEIAARLGSDVPACLAARPAWLGGVGEKIEPARQLPECGVLLVNPGVALPTPSVYRAVGPPYSRAARFTIPESAAELARLLGERGNDLTDAAIGIVPEISDVLARLDTCEGALLVRMSGSGATCFALFASNDEAARAAKRLRQEKLNWWIAAGELRRDEVALSSAPGRIS